jgi:hypothetical protein
MCWLQVSNLVEGVQQYIMGETVQVMNSFISKKKMQPIGFCGAPAHVSYCLKQTKRLTTEGKEFDSDMRLRKCLF